MKIVIVSTDHMFEVRVINGVLGLVCLAPDVLSLLA